MSLERTRFSGTASIYNRISQILFAIRFWAAIALIFTIAIFAWRSYATFKINGVTTFFLRASAYEFTVKTGQPWPLLLAENYRSAVVSQTQEYHDLYNQIFKAIQKSWIRRFRDRGVSSYSGFLVGPQGGKVTN